MKKQVEANKVDDIIKLSLLVEFFGSVNGILLDSYRRT